MDIGVSFRLKFNMKRITIHLTAICLILFFSLRGESNVTSITLTPQNPTTLSNGLGYYLAGSTYTFTVDVIDPAAASWAQISQVRIQIPGATNIDFYINPDGTGTETVTFNTGTADVAVSYSGTPTYNSFSVTFSVTMRWDTANSTWAASRTVTASCTSTNPATVTATDTKTVSYGIASQITVLGISMSGEASDGYINRWHNTFTVTGTAVYNVPGATTSDNVNVVDAGEITNSNLYIDINNPNDDGTAADGLSVSVPAAYLNTVGATDGTAYTVNFTFDTTTAGGPVTSTNSLSLTVDQVRVTDIRFTGGGGINSDPSNYFKSVSITGVNVEIDAQMSGGGGAMNGNTTFEVWNITDNVKVADVVIANGATTGTATITNPGTVGALSTETRNYRVLNIYGGAYGSTSGFGQYQTDVTYIPNQPVAHTIYWDNGDPPGTNGSAFTTEGTHTTSAGTIYFYWTALTTPGIDDDFDTYKIYYKRVADTVWTVVDRSSGAAFTSLGTITTNSISISGLEPLTDYNYRISAIDIFGNEVASADRLSSQDPLSTTASSITCTVTDGITSYGESDFSTDPAPNGNLNLKRTAIKVDIEIITSGNTPSEVALVCADNASEGTSILSTTNYVIICSKTGANTWTGYIPSTNPLITVGTETRFIVRTVFNSATAYADYDTETDGEYDSHEWRFYIASDLTFTPWPTRVFNNVITDSNPVAYPAYYLTDDAYVTITAYDIKGRPVAKLLDNALRKAGRNIKENGWRGTNKYNRKLGIGLYYLHFKAKRASDGKVIMNEFKKVVMRR